MFEHIQEWHVTLAVIILGFVITTVANRTGFKMNIRRNADRLGDHSKRIKERVEEKYCGERMNNLKEDITEIKNMHQTLSGEFKKVSDTNLILAAKVETAINGKNE